MKFALPKKLSDCFGIQFPEGKMFDLVGIGQNAFDHTLLLPAFPRFDAKMEILQYETGAGGMIACAAGFASRLGLKTKYIGKVGADASGRRTLESLSREGVDISSVIVAAGVQSHISFIMVDQDSGERTILWKRDPGLNFHTSEIRRADVGSGRVLLLDGDDIDAAITAARWAQEAGIPVVADLDQVAARSSELVALIDFLIVSANFPQEFTGCHDADAALLAMRDSCGGFLAATAGAQGARAIVDHRCLLFPGLPIHAVDTTGAGDIFHGAFIYGLLHEWSVERIMSFANAAAGLTCTGLGARQEVLSLPRIEQAAREIEKRRP
jgi:sugar/nucleoside kinase (ribokinase family)